jgi:DNA helicase-2/ATP-dependent DNA helicase PcrA
MSSYLNELNESQQQAVLQIDGPVMIVAGPGSGKTRVLTYRIANMIEKGIDPFSIMSLTFTNKAAAEMRHRIEKICGNEARNIFMGTFHSVFARLLRIDAPKLGYPSNFTIYDSQDSLSLIKTIVKELQLNDKTYKANQVFSRISNAKNALISPKAYKLDAEIMSEDMQMQKPLMGQIYEIYAKRCFQSGAMDFDDLLFKTYELLIRFPEVLYHYQHRFKYLMIDEFQDTNFAQYSIVKKIADVYHNICAVGDDAQSIYAFRGATIENILNFQKDYPDLRVFKLEQNYRSTKNIVKAANHLIVNNKNQLQKTIWTDNSDGEAIKLLKSSSDNEEAKLTADLIFEYKMRHHLKNNDFAILYRTNAQSRSYEEALRRLNIPYVIYGGMSFYQRKEIKDIIAYLRITVNHNDEEAWRRIINYPVRGIGKTTVERVTVIANERETSIFEVCENIYTTDITGKAAQNLMAFTMMIKSYKTMLDKQNAFELATHIAKSSGILKELYEDKTVEGVVRYENIQELLNGIKEFSEEDTVEEGHEEEFSVDRSLGAYLQNITLLTSQDQKADNNDSVKMMTIHSAKGLEFPAVFIGGMEENLFPSSMALYSREELEEERRLFYVAVTRAMTYLTLSFATSRYKFGNLQYCEPSRFLGEIPKEILAMHGEDKFKKEEEAFDEDFVAPVKRRIVNTGNFSASRPAAVDPNFQADDPSKILVGSEVAHQRFGNGKVVAIDGLGVNKMATIFFQGEGQKKLMLKFAKLKVLE